MATLKCKMCGGDIEVIENTTVMECEYCGSKQTVPSVDNEKLVKLYTRANRLRMNSEFDKAYSVYENIVGEFSEEAEAYWGLLLCRYGIEYVDDPATGDKVPTCHRSSFDSIMDDEDFEMVMEYADGISRRVYREQAKQIEEIRKGIIEVSGKEQPYDIFICYKETSDDGERTIDSVLAQDVYDTLVDKGYRVFFSRITLEDKLGQEYEPYIFAALNSAKVMLAFGTDYDYFNAVWVKNEWSRFLKLMAKEKSKHLIPCYKDIDAYDMPKEFAKFQAQDLGKIGATQDLLRGIDKIFGKDKAHSETNNSSDMSSQNVDIGMSALNAQTTALLKRGYMAIDDEDYTKADDFFEQVLNNDAECGQAYWGKVLCEKHVKNAEGLGLKIIQIIGKQKKTKTVVLPEPEFVKMAREADAGTGYLKDISDEELKKLLSDLNQTVSYEDGQDYYADIQKKLDDSMITAYVNSRNYERALQYADSTITENTGLILSKVKSSIEQAILKEREKIAKAKVKVEERDKSIKEVINERLSNVSRKYDEEKAKWEEEKRIAEEKAESDYQNAVEKYEEDYQSDLEKWKKDKDEFEHKYPEIEQKKSKIEEKIANLRTEYVNVKGFFAGKKKKEIDNNIKTLQNQLDSLTIPKEPGPMPEKGTAPTKDQFQTVITFHMNQLLITKCALSPEFKKSYESNVKMRKKLASAEKGETISWGRYPYGSNGEQHDIEWRVLNKTKDKLLLISKEGIDVIRYNENWVEITWEKSTIRSWLNHDFITAAFNEEEQKRLCISDVTADKNPEYDTDPGSNTKDKVFLLSVSEAKKYFENNEDRKIKPTPYAKNKNAYTNDEGNGWWWLRSPGSESKYAACVLTRGSVHANGNNVHSGKDCVRPALWLDISDLTSEIF